jgi:hypothetical protein
MQRSVASQDDEWQVPAAAVIGLQNLTGCSQPKTGAWAILAKVSLGVGRQQTTTLHVAWCMAT